MLGSDFCHLELDSVLLSPFCLLLVQKQFKKIVRDDKKDDADEQSGMFSKMGRTN